GGPNALELNNCKPLNSNDDAALLIGGRGGPYIPSPGDFSDVTIVSAGHGIDALWEAPGFGPDLTGGFTFAAISGCRQTQNGLLGAGGSGRGQEGCLVN